MFKTSLYTIFAAAGFAVLLSCSNVQSKQKASVLPAVKTGSGIHVVELFTSEGCSSCPPAERLIDALKAEGDSNVFVLSYHVDYWDHLGWKDPYSEAAFSDRQRQYAQRLSLESIYTPQVIVNGSEEFVGSDENRLRASLQKANLNAIAIQASVKRITNENVQLAYSSSSASPLLLNVALLQPEATTDVKRGENEGRTLHHVNVVRALKTVDAQRSGTIEFALPTELSKTLLTMIVFAQEKGTGKIMGATQLNIPL